MEHCENYTALISAAVDGELTEAEREELMDHLAQCPGCREVYSRRWNCPETWQET